MVKVKGHTDQGQGHCGKQRQVGSHQRQVASLCIVFIVSCFFFSLCIDIPLISKVGVMLYFHCIYFTDGLGKSTDSNSTRI